MTTHVTIIWYDTDNIEEEIFSKYNDYTFNFYNNKSQCVDYISSTIKSEIIFLISSISCALDILPTIHGLRQLDSVFIYSNKPKHQIDESLLDIYCKIIGIFSQFEDVFQSIEENIDLTIKQVESFKFYEQYQKSTRDLSKESGSFLWLRLFKDVILKLPHDEQAKQEMIEKLKEYYRNNNHQLKLVEKFNREYKSKNAIHWYTGQPFLYKQINRALRTEDIELLYKFRYFISDLSKNLYEEYELLKMSLDSTLKFYRGVKLLNKEVKKLEENVGKLISTNGYFSTSFSKKVALAFADKSTENETSVLFKIKCDLGNINSIIMASIAHCSTNRDEEEVLFDLDAAFKILSVSKDVSSNVVVVKMEATDEGATLAQEHIKEHNRQLSTSSVVLVFGRLLADIGQYEKSKQYFHRLEKTSNEEDIAFIYYYLGDAYCYQGDYERAFKYYQDSYKMLVNAEPPRDLASSYLLNNIGLIFSIKGQYDEALDYYMRAFQIRKIYSDYPAITTSMESIGMIYQKKGEYNKALEYLTLSREIREKYLPGEHKDIARVLSNIAVVYGDMDQLNTALEYHKKSLEINEKCLPIGHNNIGLSLNRIGTILTNQGKYDEALEYYMRANKIRKDTFPNGHLSIALGLSNVGYIYYTKQNYILALDYLEESLQMRETLFADIKDLALVNILTYFGLVYIKLHKYDNALTYHVRALKVSEDIFPIGHSNISDCLTNIGIAYRGMSDYSKAFEYYEKATKNEEQNSIKPDIIRLARNYDNMGICLCDQGEEEIGLEYRMKSVRIIEKVHPRIHYATVIDSIGDIFFIKEIYNNALECYFISLNMKLKCLPTDSVNTAETLVNIGDVYFEQEKVQHCESNEQYQIKARFYYQKALDIYTKKIDVNTIRALNRIGSIYEYIHKYHLALGYYRQAVEISENNFSFDDSIKEINDDNIARVKWLMK